MDIDSGDDIWGAGGCDEEAHDVERVSESTNRSESTLTAMGYSEDAAEMNEDGTMSGTPLLKSMLYKVGVTLLGFVGAALRADIPGPHLIAVEKAFSALTHRRASQQHLSERSDSVFV